MFFVLNRSYIGSLKKYLYTFFSYLTIVNLHWLIFFTIGFKMQRNFLEVIHLWTFEPRGENKINMFRVWICSTNKVKIWNSKKNHFFVSDGVTSRQKSWNILVSNGSTENVKSILNGTDLYWEASRAGSSK